MTTEPANYNFDLLQGDTFNDVWTITDENDVPLNLTGYSARMFLRASVDAAATLLEATTANSRIVLGDILGTVTFAVSSTLTAALPPGNAAYDLELTSGSGVVSTWLAGTITVRRKVTR